MKYIIQLLSTLTHFCLLNLSKTEGGISTLPLLLKVKVKVTQLCHGLYSPWNSPGQNTEVGSLSLLQGICPTQGSNPGLPHCRRILYQLSHKGSPRILEWVAYPFSSGSSQPRNWTGVSCFAGRFYTNWVTREAPTVVEFLSFSVCICYSPGFTYFTVILFSTKNLMMLMSFLWLVPFINIKEPFLSYLMPF